MRVFLFFLALSLVGAQGFSQTGTISGQVTDATTGEPLPYCNVFVDNSTYVTITSIDGTYVLSGIPAGNLEIGFSFLGYEPLKKPILVKTDGKSILNVVMASTDQELSDVEIKASRDKAWERELRKFKNLFLGNDQLASNCEILNPWVIDFPENNTNNNFSATALQPIEIRNGGLGYMITFDLAAFNFTPNSSVISGASRFVELEAPDEKTKQLWEKSRLETYLRSSTNMFRSILSDSHNEQGFQLYGDKPGGSESSNLRTDVFANELGKSVIAYKPQNMVSTGRNPGEYKILMKGRIEIHYEKSYSSVNTYKDAPYPISWVEVTGNYVSVNSAGIVLNPKDVVFSGDMDKRKVATLLPVDYQPTSMAAASQIAKDANSLQEKVYLHTDRPYYYQGNQLFFKAYIQYKNPEFKNELSKILYVELLSKDRDVIIQKKYKIQNGQVAGDLYLPDSLNQKEYYLRSYTNWNRNYGPDTYFVKGLPILTPYDRIASIESEDAASRLVNLSFKTDKESYGKREKVKLGVALIDKEGRPVSSHLSVAVFDTQFTSVMEDTNDISKILTMKEVPPQISTDKFSHPVEMDWKVNGKYLNEKGKAVPTSFTAYFNNYQGVLDLETDKAGNFTLEGMDFFGPLDFAFLAVDKKGKVNGTFEITPKMAPPFFIPQHISFPKVSTTSAALFQGWETKIDEVVELKSITVSGGELGKSRAIYGNPDHVVKAESLMRGGNSVDLLLSLKGFIPGMVVTTSGQVTLRGGATSVANSMEPMVMVDGAILPGNSAASNINSINPNDVERIEVVSRMSSIMGDMGRNGIIAIYLKKGIKEEPKISSGTTGITEIILEGYAIPTNFFEVDHENGEMQMELDQRATLYWNPYLITDSETGEFTLEFYTNDHLSPKYVVVEGLGIDGTPFRGTYLIPMAKN